MPIKKSVDKGKLMKIVEEKSYDLMLHFSKKLTVPLTEQSGSKAKSYTLLRAGSKTNKLTAIVAFHSNTALEYSIDLDVTDAKAKTKFEFG